MTTAELESVVEGLRQRPLVLLLGQHFLFRRDKDNPIFDFSSGQIEGDSFYASWLSNPLNIDARSKHLSDSGMAVTIPEAAQYLRDCPWRCVFTSNIDPTPRRLLQIANTRQVLEKFERADNPEQTVLPLFRLFGSSDRQELRELPPADRNALRQQRATAQEIMRPLAEFVTPTGCLLIEGWNPEDDWLRPRDLAPALTGLGADQVLIFGQDESSYKALENDDDFADLVAGGIVKIFKLTLSEALEQITERGLFDFADPELKAPAEKVFNVVEKTPRDLRPANKDQLKQLVFSQHEWQSFNETLEILLPIGFTRHLAATSEEKYKAFRRFLGHGPDTQLDIIRHLAFRRPILDQQIEPMIQKLLLEASPQDYVVLIAGQSGVGKTVLLSLLAVDLREAGIPVALIRRGVVPPNLSQLDKFAQRVESITKVPIAIVYDGLCDEAEYASVAHFLGSRGRKVLVIGSVHGSDAPPAGTRTDSRPLSIRRSGKNTRFRRITVPVQLDDAERELLISYLGKYLPEDIPSIKRLIEGGYDNFFAMLYRLLDSARQRLRDGLIREIEAAADRFDRRVEKDAAEIQTQPGKITAMQYALRSALGDRLLVSENEKSSTDTKDVTQTKIGARKMVNAILVASQYGVDVPQGIALNILPRQEWFEAYRQALESFHVIDARYVAGDYCVLSARHPLEARLWCERHIHERKEQFALIREMVLQLRSSQVNDDHSPELNFVLQLLRAIGPQGKIPNSMPDHYGDIARLINELRTSHAQALHPRLLLIESNAAREWVQRQQPRIGERVRRGEECDSHTVRSQVQELLDMLQRAERSLNDAIAAIRASQAQPKFTPGASRMMAVLYTELACVLGAQQQTHRFLVQMNIITQSDGFVRQIDGLLDRAIQAWRRARSFQEDNYQALDAACWILRDRFEIKPIDPSREAELLAEWSEIIEQYREQDLSSDEEEKFDRRESEFSRQLGDITRFESVMERMIQKGMNAAHTLRARYIGQERGCAAARAYIEDKCANILEIDRPVLLYYFRLWWETETRYPSYFDHDHMTLAFTASQWARLAKLARARLSLEGEQDNCVSLFHLGWASLQTGQTLQAREAFERLEMVSADSFRRARSLCVISNVDGSPREFLGETRGRIVGNRGRGWIDELRMEIDYPLSEFSEVDTRPGRPLGPFHIALNYRGAFAQPLHRFPKSTDI